MQGLRRLFQILPLQFSRLFSVTLFDRNSFLRNNLVGFSSIGLFIIANERWEDFFQTSEPSWRGSVSRLELQHMQAKQKVNGNIKMQPVEIRNMVKGSIIVILIYRSIYLAISDTDKVVPQTPFFKNVLPLIKWRNN